MAFRIGNLLSKYHIFFDYNFPTILAATTFSGSVAGAVVAYNDVETCKTVKEKSVWDYGKIGLGSCAGGIAGLIAGALLKQVIIPCAVVTSAVCGVAKAYDTVKGRRT